MSYTETISQSTSPSDTVPISEYIIILDSEYGFKFLGALL